MRILVIAGEWFPESKSGLARVATDTSCLLAARGHAVTVLGPRSGREGVERHVNLEVHRILARRWPVTFTDVFEVARHIATFRPSSFDVVVTHNAATTVGLWAARCRSPFVRVYHASGVREMRFLRTRLPHGRRRLATYLREPPLALFGRIAAASATRTFVLSDFTQSVFLAAHPTEGHRLRRVSAGVDVDWFSPGDGRSAARARLGLGEPMQLLLSVRRFVPRMGLEELLYALAALRASRDVRLALVGRGELEAELRRLSAALRLGDSVRFVGSVTDDALRDWYRAADLFVLPTLAEEGFGMVTAEALSTGTPVVGTPVGATPELLEPLDPRFVSDGTDPAALAAAIDRGLGLVTDELRGRCRAYACARLSWNVAIRKWEDALAEAAADRLGS
jgi:glycosyltransferase involved in cell wall biosynthesis